MTFNQNQKERIKSWLAGDLLLAEANVAAIIHLALITVCFDTSSAGDREVGQGIGVIPLFFPKHVLKSSTFTNPRSISCLRDEATRCSDFCPQQQKMRFEHDLSA